jgi:pimeloyl-ACP methyl ester carboxylesterase
MANPLAAFIIRPIKKHQNAKKMIISSPAGVQEERFEKIGGLEQWITIRGENKNNPVILFIHGGPGSPYTPFSSWLHDWEKYFTIVQWDQPGSGRTFSKNGIEGSGRLTFDRLSNDGIELSRFLCTRLNKTKIILIGSSAGSLTGLWMIKKCPELFYAYIGVEQNSPDSDKVTYNLTRESVVKANDKKSLVLLDEMGSNPSNWTRQQSEMLIKIAIQTSKQVPNMINDLMLPALLFAPDYSMQDILTVQKGMEFSTDQLLEEMSAFDFNHVGYEFKLPFFIFQGEGDILTPVSTAKNYFDRIKAPHKKFVVIKNAGHLAEFANHEQFLKELLDCVMPLIK